MIILFSIIVLEQFVVVWVKEHDKKIIELKCLIEKTTRIIT